MDAALPLDTTGPGRVSAKVYDLLRDAIIQLKLRPGNPLSESELAKRLDVSRQPVREAFIKLAEAGLVEVRPQRGTYVLMISRREVETARFVREAVEVAFVRKAAVDLKLTPDNGVRVSITGDVALNDEQFATVSDLFLAGGENAIRLTKAGFRGRAVGVDPAQT